MQSFSPCVSILIPCHNAERWIAQAIRSALDQTWSDKEVIVDDDGSTDRSLEIIRSFGDSIRFETGPNRGGNAARNRLLELARGEWLQYLDADDYLLPGKIEQQWKELPDRHAADAAYSPVILEHWKDDRIAGREESPIPEPHDPWILLARWWLPQTGGLLWRKSALVSAGGWDESFPCCQEHDLYLRALIAGCRFQYCPTAGAVYRQWSEQTVCKRNQPEVHRRRLQIEQRAEDWLRAHGRLTDERLAALNQARFEIARSIWQYDSQLARRVMRVVRRSQPDFLPSGAAAPANYRAAFRMLGFRGAEHLADWKRLFANRTRMSRSMTAVSEVSRPHDPPVLDRAF